LAGNEAPAFGGVSFGLRQVSLKRGWVHGR
jgi:hypothetical protein